MAFPLTNVRGRAAGVALRRPLDRAVGGRTPWAGSVTLHRRTISDGSDIVSEPIAVPDHLDLKTARGVETITVKRLGHAEWKLCQSRAFTQIYEHYGEHANDVMDMARRARESREQQQKLLGTGAVPDEPDVDPHKDVEAAFQANHPDWLCALGVTRFDGRTLTRSMWLDRITSGISTESVLWCAEQVLRFEGQYLPETEEQEKNVS